MTQSDALNEGREVKIIFPVHPGDWPEDFDHENGNYIGLCRECGHSFRGHKRRFICKICMQPDWENIAKIKKPEDKGKGPFEGCWQEGEMVGYAKCMITKVRELRYQLSKEREKVDSLERWKKEQMQVWGPVLDYMQDGGSGKRGPIGASISELVLQILKNYYEGKEREIRKELVEGAKSLLQMLQPFENMEAMRPLESFRMREIEQLIAKASELDKT